MIFLFFFMTTMEPSKDRDRDREKERAKDCNHDVSYRVTDDSCVEDSLEQECS